ncbi:MAG: enoyl-CoA hydratase/isomerase family protein [Phenylobacterium sp.]|uniref:enoyl-CoA hydratase/isomerase family protein n=1 Tax=Phenylobacterium sp. TaxID=1871053 RepID=UPI00273277C3|nr:enoyl-CoA hydratase/isomerase family protein [Phenylobacterium sp.]MDP3173895.1 enoyl-CoA hydratase/isomerase family protein [Phenylobacterium sp.]
MSGSDVLQVERRGDVEIVTLNRPDALNALNPDLVEALLAYWQGLQENNDIRVVVLRAAGRAFCAGLDLKGWGDFSSEPSVANALYMQRRIGRIMRMMRTCPQPVICLVQGAAAGGGMSLALAADVRYATPDMRMNAAFIRIGLGGADMGSSYFLPRLVGHSVASELLLSGRFIQAERALKVGLISDIVEPDALLDAGLALADDMLLAAPMGLRLTKDALNLNIDASGIEAAMAIEDRQQVMLSNTADHGEAVAAFLQKRKPVWQGK